MLGMTCKYLCCWINGSNWFLHSFDCIRKCFFFAHSKIPKRMLLNTNLHPSSLATLPCSFSVSHTTHTLPNAVAIAPPKYLSTASIDGQIEKWLLPFVDAFASATSLTESAAAKSAVTGSLETGHLTPGNQTTNMDVNLRENWKTHIQQYLKHLAYIKSEMTALKWLLFEEYKYRQAADSTMVAQELEDFQTDDKLMKALSNDYTATLEEMYSFIIENYALMRFSEQSEALQQSKNDIVLEVRPGVGGEEACLFAMEIFQMYKRSARSYNWNFSVVNLIPSDEKGGSKEAIAHISGPQVFDFFKYESGIHRVQRVPVTDKMQRIHTSTASVVILPKINTSSGKFGSFPPHEFRYETMRSSGPGGQSVNKSETAVRVTHIPSKMSVTVRETSSQSLNKQIGIEIITSRLVDKNQQQLQQAEKRSRSFQIGSGDRSEKIRTYNMPQNRVIDHRCKHKAIDAFRFLEDGTGFSEIVFQLKLMEEKEIIVSVMQHFFDEMDIVIPKND